MPAALLPVTMVASGVCSALMYAPNLVLVAEMARRGAGEGLFGAFQIAGSLGFLTGPIVGGILVEVTRRIGGEVAYREIFVGVGAAVALPVEGDERRHLDEHGVVVASTAGTPLRPAEVISDQ